MSRRRKQTIEEYYSPRMVETLRAATCPHEEPRGSLYCALCRKGYMRGDWSLW